VPNSVNKPCTHVQIYMYMYRRMQAEKSFPRRFRTSVRYQLVHHMQGASCIWCITLTRLCTCTYTSGHLTSSAVVSQLLSVSLSLPSLPSWHKQHWPRACRGSSPYSGIHSLGLPSHVCSCVSPSKSAYLFYWPNACRHANKLCASAHHSSALTCTQDR
jgi:hypothetical protein